MKFVIDYCKNYVRNNKSFFALLFLFLLVRSTFANQYVVPTGSMLPTIQLGDRIFVNRVAYDLKLPFSNIILKRFDEPKHGDIIVFDSPAKPGLTLIKRLIALPGDHLVIDNGFVTINDKKLDNFDGKSPNYTEVSGEHTYLIQRIPEMARREHLDVVVPPDHYFMMGDNRDNSADSRVIGFVARELLIGKAKNVLFSVNFSRPFEDMVMWNRIGHKLL